MLGQAERIIELKNLFDSRSNAPQKTLRTPNIFAFVSGKGGTGKTFLSLNISFELARMNKKVLYVDIDLNMANAHIMLDINPEKTLFDFYSGRALFDDIVFHYNENLDIIFGDSGRSSFPEDSSEVIEDLLKRIRDLENYDVIILDLAAGAGKSVFVPLSYSDYSIMVATPEPTAVMDAYALSKLMLTNKLNCRQLVLFNKIKSYEEGEQAYSNLNSAMLHFLKRKSELLNYILYSEDAYNSICSQKLAVVNFFNSDVAAQIRNSASKINDILQLANIHQ